MTKSQLVCLRERERERERDFTRMKKKNLKNIFYSYKKERGK